MLGEQSKQRTEHKTPGDIFNLLAEVKELIKIVTEQKQQIEELTERVTIHRCFHDSTDDEQKEMEQLNEMLEKVRRIKKKYSICIG